MAVEIKMLKEKNIKQVHRISWVNSPSRTEPLSNNKGLKSIFNCKNCGAPLHGIKCDYCGTEYI